MKRFISVVCFMCTLILAACGTVEVTITRGASETGTDSGSALAADDEAIISLVMDNFKLLAQIPRPSHHEEKISDFLMNWTKEQGFSPERDDTKNIMFDIPATEGFEDYPLAILQGHMDMVAVAEDGKVFDPQNDPITVVRDEEKNTLTADGTSLGADDGAGVSIIMAVAQGKMKHGPLRVIITVDEEDGMEGAFNVDKTWLEGADYLLNIDEEKSTLVTVSTAGGYAIDVSKQINLQDTAGDQALKLVLKGLKGGHSGDEIGEGRLNGIIGLAKFLKLLDEEGITFELADFKGGNASNAIPSKAECSIVISEGDLETVKKLAETYLETLREDYKGIEDDISFSVTETDDLPKVVSPEEKENTIDFMTEARDGVNTWSADMEGLVESSSNFGVFSVGNDGVSGTITIRSSSPEKQDELISDYINLAEKCGFETKMTKMADPWPYDPDSRLMELAKEVYREQNGEEIEVKAVHGGLECGTFSKLDPNLDLISIGPDITDVHTPRETLYLDSVPRTWKLLEGILLKIGK